MKKVFSFTAFTIIVLFIFACELKVPSSVEIRGTPELRFGASLDISKIFSDQIKDGFSSGDGNTYIQECTNNALDIQTFLIGMNMIEETFKFSIGGGNQLEIGDGNTYGTTPDGSDYKLSSKVQLSEPDASFPVHLSDMQNTLNGLKFNNVRASLFIECASPVINIMEIELDFDNAATAVYNNLVSIPSGVNPAGNVYTALAMPADGIDISDKIRDLLNKETESKIGYNVYIPAGKTITNAMLNNDIDIKAEIVIWLPLSFIAEEGAEFLLPGDLFSQNGDLFGREKADDENSVSDMIESLSFAIKLNWNIFSGLTLRASSKAGNLVFVNQITGNSLEFSMDEQDMKKVNNPANYPFIPEIRILFPAGKTISFPRNFSVTEVAFKAKLSYLIDLSGGDN